ncbi:MAG: SCP2 sterol-binding domain-containing protein [Hydrogenothermaceae bacterium]
MREFQQIVNLVEEINTNHKHHLSSLGESDKLLLVIKSEDGKTFLIKISRNGLEIIKEQPVTEFKNIVEISLKDLLKLMNHKSYIIRYMMTGKIKVKGNIKKVFDILQNL